MFNKEILDKQKTLENFILGLDVGIISIKDIAMLTTAFIHKSYAADFVEIMPFNERLEFLGDGILGASVNKLLFQKYADAAESKLTLLKIGLVREETLAEVARDIHLGQYVFLGKGERRQNGEEKNSILSDTLEAILGFFYIDAGIGVVENFVEKYLFIKLEEVAQREGKSFKSILQEYAQKHFKVLPVYDTIDFHVDDKKNVTQYCSKIYINDQCVGTGYAKNKKKAQEEAAKDAYYANHLH